jgi:N-formylglutamate amidohydrolase
MDTFTLHRGRVPLLISLPHDGSFIPDDIAARMLPQARRSLDTDWHVARLYAPLAQELGASVLKPQASRYVVDLNRPADGHALYPGQRETGVVPLVGFDGEPLYASGQAPDAAEVQRRINEFWQPYHQAITQELVRLLLNLHRHLGLSSPRRGQHRDALQLDGDWRWQCVDTDRGATRIDSGEMLCVQLVVGGKVA